MMHWFKGLKRIERLCLLILFTVVIVWAGVFLRNMLVGTKEVEARLGTEQAGAAMQSGQDAVGTVGRNQAKESATDARVQEIEDEVDAANDAAGADAAGRNGLCQQFGLCD